MSAQAALYEDGSERWGLVEGDSLDLLPRLPDHCIDAVVSDPPYAIQFHGEHWDRQPGPAAFADWTRQWAAQCRRVLKPGGYLAAFGAPRTFHRLVSGIEDAGLEIRDLLIWLNGQGLPKSRRLPGGHGLALRPGYEPIVLARVPLAGRLEENRSTYGTGALHVGRAGKRWPTNVVLSHAPACDENECASECAVALLDRTHPDVRPSRFFYCAKASISEREAGCDQLPVRYIQLYTGHSHRPRAARNIHPTVKPLALMRWLVQMVAPEGGMVLDPFAGSGSTGAAAVLEGRRFLGIEREGSYVDIACARISYWVLDRARESP